jgi:hypothetical protein
MAVLDIVRFNDMLYPLGLAVRDKEWDNPSFRYDD